MNNHPMIVINDIAGCINGIEQLSEKMDKDYEYLAHSCRLIDYEWRNMRLNEELIDVLKAHNELVERYKKEIRKAMLVLSKRGINQSEFYKRLF